MRRKLMTAEGYKGALKGKCSQFLIEPKQSGEMKAKKAKTPDKPAVTKEAEIRERQRIQELNSGAHFDFKEVVEEMREINNQRKNVILQEYLAKKAIREEMRKKLYARRLSIAETKCVWNGPPLIPP